MSGRWTIFGVWLGAFLLSYFFRSANAVIAPDLREAFGLDAAQLGLMTSTFFAAVALAQLPLGAALDRWGPRLVVPALMLAGVAGAVVFATATTFAALTVGRTLLGLGFAGVLMGALHAFGRWFPDRRFATVSGLLVGLGTSGALLAGTPLAYLAATFGWRAVFAGGAVVVTLSAAAIALATRDAPPGAPPLRSTDGGSLASVLGDQRFWRIALMNLFAVGSLLAVQGLWAGPYLADVHGLSSLRVGDLILVMALGVVVGNLASGALADQFGRGRVVLVAAAVFTACHALFAAAPAGAPVPLLAVLYFAFGASGSIGSVLFALARGIVPAHLNGRVITAVNLVGIAGAMAIQWAMGAIIELGREAAGDYGPAAYQPAFLLTTAIGLAALWAFAGIARSAETSLRRAGTDHPDTAWPGERTERP
jgi:predicted MFS family arabinose efflux permease